MNTRMGFHTKAVTSLRKNPGGTGSAVSKMPGESASAAYVRHEGLYLNIVRCHNYACLCHPVSRTRLFEHRFLFCRCLLRRGIPETLPPALPAPPGHLLLY